MIKDIKHIRTRLKDISMILFLMNDTLDSIEESIDESELKLLFDDIGVLNELIMRLENELNS